jgi:hypothetical protein
LQTEITRIQAGDPRAKGIEVNCPLQERPGKGSIVDIGEREQEQQRRFLFDRTFVLAFVCPDKACSWESRESRELHLLRYHL